MSTASIIMMAFLGDAFFELTVRSRLSKQNSAYAADKLHNEAVRYVNAAAQAKAVRGLIAENYLTEEEQDIVRRARNHRPKSIPKNANPLEYKFATALEALLGYHFMAERSGRAEELAGLAIEIIDRDKG